MEEADGETVPNVWAGELKGFRFGRIGSNDATKYIVNVRLDRGTVFFKCPLVKLMQSL